MTQPVNVRQKTTKIIEKIDNLIPTLLIHKNLSHSDPRVILFFMENLPTTPVSSMRTISIIDLLCCFLRDCATVQIFVPFSLKRALFASKFQALRDLEETSNKLRSSDLFPATASSAHEEQQELLNTSVNGRTSFIHPSRNHRSQCGYNAICNCFGCRIHADKLCNWKLDPCLQQSSQRDTSIRWSVFDSRPRNWRGFG